MAIEVELPDKSIAEFPDDMPHADIEAALASHFKVPLPKTTTAPFEVPMGVPTGERPTRTELSIPETEAIKRVGRGQGYTEADQPVGEVSPLAIPALAVQRIGKAAFKALPADLASTPAEMTPEEAAKRPLGEVFPNVKAALMGEKLPIESTMENIKSPAISFPYKVTSGILESAPSLAAVAASGPAAPVTAAALFGFNDKGEFQPAQAVVAAGLPVVGKIAGPLAESLASKLGVKSDVALNWINTGGRYAAGNAVVAAQQAAQLAPDWGKMTPEQKRQAVIDSVASMLVNGLLSLGDLDSNNHEQMTFRRTLANDPTLTTLLSGSRNIPQSQQDFWQGVAQAKASGLNRTADELLSQPIPKGGEESAQGIREDAGQPAKAGQVVKGSEANRGDDLQQASPKPSQPVVEGKTPTSEVALTPDPAQRLEDLRKMPNRTPEQEAEFQGLLKKSASVKEQMASELEKLKQQGNQNDITRTVENKDIAEKRTGTTIPTEGNIGVPIGQVGGASGSEQATESGGVGDRGPVRDIAAGESIPQGVGQPRQSVIFDTIAKRDRRDWSKVPQSFERDAVAAAFNDVRGLIPKSDVRARINASKATTFNELREALDKYKSYPSSTPPKEVIPSEEAKKEETGLLSAPAAETTPAAAPKYRVGNNPTLHEIVETLPQSPSEKSNNEQPVRVRNTKTGETSVVMQGDLTEVQPKAEGAKAPKRDLDAELKEAGLDPGVFQNATQKREALRRAKARGMGAARLGETPEKTQIEQLEESLRNVQSRKVPWIDKVKQAFNLGERISQAKDAIGKAVSGLRATGRLLKQRWMGYNTIDQMLRAKGELSAATEKRGWALREFENTVRRQIPDPKRRAAIAKYIDAGGDIAELKRGESETPEEYKQAYRDAQNLTPDEKLAAENIRNFFESRLDEAIEAGVLESGVEDYLHRIYESRPGDLKKALAYTQSGILSQNPALAKKRVFQFDWEAEKLGFKPVQDFLTRIATYEGSLSRAIAARDFVKKALSMKAPDGRPVVDVKGVGVPVTDSSGVREATLIKPQFNPAKSNTPGTSNYRGDYVNREFPALSKWKWVALDSAGKPIFVQGDVAIHPEYVGRINALLEPSRVRYGRYPRIGKALLGASSTVKSTLLDFSGFHQVQLAVHGLEHKVLPTRLVQDIDFQNPNVDGLLKGGITLGGEYYHASEGVFGKSLSRLVPGIGPLMDTYHQWLFRDYIPRLKMTMALDALERNRSRFADDLKSGRMTEEQLYHKTASQANAAFGELNYTMLERSKTAQDISRLILLAPDFLEARGRFVAQGLEKGGKNFRNEQRSALLLGALTMYATARVLNKAISGQWHNEPENMFSVVYNGKAYGLRTVQGDILHMLSAPLSFWLHRLNPVLTRPALEMVTGRDEFGRKRSPAEQAWDAASVVMPASLRSSRERSLWESMANAFGITARRWNATDDAFKLAQKWKDAHGVGGKGEFIYDPEKDALRPLKIALSNNDEGGATREIKKLLDSKQYTGAKLAQYFNRYAAMPFTGSRANDLKFIATLSDDQKQTVKAATQSKMEMRKLYFSAMKKYVDASKGEK